jgi:hypothetical protein
MSTWMYLVDLVKKHVSKFRGWWWSHAHHSDPNELRFAAASTHLPPHIARPARARGLPQKAAPVPRVVFRAGRAGPLACAAEVGASYKGESLGFVYTKKCAIIFHHIPQLYIVQLWVCTYTLCIYIYIQYIYICIYNIYYICFYRYLFIIIYVMIFYVIKHILVQDFTTGTFQPNFRHDFIRHGLASV